MVSDDVKVSQLVAVVKHRCGDPACDHECSGRPFKVVSMSYPFVVLEDCIDGERLSLDLRNWELGKVSAGYVKALAGEVGRRTVKELKPVEDRTDHKRCIRCGDQLVQRMEKRGRQWCWYCRQCERAMEVVT
ncbi:MAG: hypothetical protein WBQ94_12185 [Terracidiphilus sp.]